MRYFAEVAYEGAPYSGWQVQPGQTTVQGVIEGALGKLLRTPTAIVGSGRTDAGVHCRQQFFHFETDDARYPLPDLTYKLNAVLPREVSVPRIWPVEPTAHARFDALRREYRYFVLKRKDPFRWRHGWLCPRQPDISLMNAAAAHLLGQQDFEVFCKAKSGAKHYRCDISYARWADEGDALVFTVKADRFLRGMVRLIVGTLAEAGWRTYPPEAVADIIGQKDKSRLGKSAPAQGLFLWEVAYPERVMQGIDE